MHIIAYQLTLYHGFQLIIRVRMGIDSCFFAGRLKFD